MQKHVTSEQVAEFEITTLARDLRRRRSSPAYAIRRYIDETLQLNGLYRLPYESDGDALARLEWAAHHTRPDVDTLPSIPAAFDWEEISGVRTLRSVRASEAV